MSKLKWMACLMPMLITGCVTSGPTDSFCTVAQPIYIGKEDKFSPETGRKILTHDETGRKLCGW